ncbi:MAG: rhodanese-like domain-containing protein [Verrucomicrobiales bacterium]|nr:rhodanese-like domain-containing protein [Verrucomicrobiales bacterium]
MSIGWVARLGPWPTRLGQAGVLLGLSSLLGLTFNASNPLGVRWTKAPPATPTPTALQRAPSTPAAPALEPTLTTSVPPATSRVDPALPPFPPLPPPRRTTSSAPALAAAAPAAGRPSPPPGPSPVSLPAFRAPVSVHWNEIKPLTEAGTALLVDVRIKPAYDAGHIPGAVHLAENSTPEQIGAFRARHGTNQYLVAYCSSTSCSLSYRLAQKLVRDYGFAKVDYMTGGYVEYQRETALAAGVGAPPANRSPAPTPSAVEQTPLPGPTTSPLTP